MGLKNVPVTSFEDMLRPSNSNGNVIKNDPKQQSYKSEKHVSSPNTGAPDIVEKTNELDISELMSYPNHKFKLYKGQQLLDMVESIRTYGILEPIVVWKNNEDQHIILSGHNRAKAATLAGFTKAPVVIKQNLTDDEAALIVVETNLRQRSFSDLSHSERAYSLAEHYEALKKQGKRNDLIQEIDTLCGTSSSAVHTSMRTDVQLGKNLGLGKDKVARYIKISKLDKSLMDLLDADRLSFTPAYILSFVEDKLLQREIADILETTKYTINLKKAEQLKDCFKKDDLDITTVYSIISGEYLKGTVAKQKKHYVSDELLLKYQVNLQSQTEVNYVIEKALEEYFAKRANS